MTKIGFVRHGVTRWNKEGRAQGSSDIPLDEEGLKQARLLAEQMDAGEWDVVYTSDLLRTKQTADTLNDKLGAPLHEDARLREKSCGLIEGTTEAERVQQWGPEWRELDMQVESHDSIISRGLSFIDDINDKHMNQNILVVSHGTFIRLLFQALLPDPDMDKSLGNTSLTLLKNSGSGWYCELYNWAGHILAEEDSLRM